MKHAKFLNLFVATLVLSLGITGCKHKPKDTTPILGRTGQVGDGSKPFPSEAGTGTKIDDAQSVKPIDTTAGGIGQNVRFDPGSMNQDPGRFAANTVYFDFDRATIKPSETSKIDDVVKYLQGNPTHAMQIEGHCDERGTEQYNLSLGERRALAVREYLVTAGIQPDRVFTISYGEARPAESGHNEAAWSKNRRGAFVLLTPK
ncbi:MAG TPA: OmpA family protein [Candidatus Angelobacter sp.]|nr:OmpA family protein [Candidatus Angelobacter sp.]